MTMKVPAFKVDEHIIWGATAMILSEFAASFVRSLMTKKRDHL
jgi:hypothetical protein